MVPLNDKTDESLEEHRRMALLAELGVLDTAPEPGFDALVHAASVVADCPMALVALLDGDRQWFKARRGIDLTHSPRQWSFCSHALQSGALMEVPDANADPRFADNPFVVGEPHLRFYAGQPLTVDGIAIGTLCVMDTRPRELLPKVREALSGLATAASALLAERRSRIASFEQQRRLTDFAMVSGDWLWETDAEHRVVWMSCGYATHPPLPEPWLLGQPMADAPVLDVAGNAVAPPLTLHRLFEQKRAFARAIVRSDTAGGPYFLLHSAVCRRDDAGAWCGYRGIARDMRARVKAEQARIDAAAVLAELSAQVPGLIFQFRREVDGRMCFPYVSERVAELQLTAEQLAADAGAALALCHPQDAARVLRSIDHSAAELSIWQETFRMALPSRGERIFSGHAKPKRLDDGAVLWQGLLTDVTEQVQKAERLQAMSDAKAAADKAAQLRSEFMSRVSHELRTPLNAILGFAQLLRLNGASQPGTDTLKAAAQIEHAGTHLLSLVNDMLDLSSLDAGRMNLQLCPVALAPLLQRCLALIEPHARQHGMTFDLQADPDAPTVRADLRAVKQVIFNLVGNAIKFARPNSAVRLRVLRLPADAQVLLEVIDAGPGIAADQLASLFEPFSRIDSGAGAPVGSGLGLSISRQLVMAMAGRIDVESTVGVGTTFRVQLPVDGRPAPTGPETDGDRPDADARAAASAPVGGATVLYIEDEPVNALLMQEFFRSMPAARLVSADNGLDGVREARLRRPDLILLDMHLPDLDGIEVLQRLRGDPATACIPVIALSADALPEQVRRAQLAGFEDYWTKPVDFRQVRADLLRRFPAGRMPGGNSAP